MENYWRWSRRVMRTTEGRPWHVPSQDIMMIIHWRKWRDLKYILYIKLIGLALGFYLRWWRGETNNEENWNGQYMFEGQGIRKLRIQFYTYSVWNTCETSMWRCQIGSWIKEFGESLSYLESINIYSFCKDFGVDHSKGVDWIAWGNDCPIINYILFYFLLGLIKSNINLVHICILKNSFVYKKDNKLEFYFAELF